jgi:hypothetical protein
MDRLQYSHELIKKLRHLFYESNDTNNEDEITNILNRALLLTHASIIHDKKYSVNNSLRAITYYIVSLRSTLSMCGDIAKEDVVKLFSEFSEFLTLFLSKSEEV